MIIGNTRMNTGAGKKASLLCAFVVLALSTSASGAWYDENPAVKPDIPDIGWVSTNLELTGGDGYCGYVAAANVLFYWDSHGLCDLIPDGTTPDQLMTQFIDYANPAPPIWGLSCDELEVGLENYLAAKGYGYMVVTQYNPPEIDFDLIMSELMLCQQVIVGMAAPASHWVTATGWYVDGADDFWLGVHDPNSITEDEEYYETDQTTGMYVYYDNDWAEADNIITVCVPEPVSLSVLALGGLVLLRRRHK